MEAPVIKHLNSYFSKYKKLYDLNIMGEFLHVVVFINLLHSSIEHVASSGTAELQILICYDESDLDKGLCHITLCVGFLFILLGKR